MSQRLSANIRLIHRQPGNRLNPQRRGEGLTLLRHGLVRYSERGSSLVFALIFVFVVLATSLMVSNRGLLGMVGSFFNQDSKLARDAADIGILRAVMLLNEPQNRYLLAKADQIDSATGAEIAANKDFLNPCLGTLQPDVVNTTMGIKVSNSATYPTINIDDGTATNGIQRRFRIKQIQQNGLPNSNTGTTGGIVITVIGEAVDKNGMVLSSSTIPRELEVVPKCCGLSLGGPSGAFGGDNRQCDQGNPGLGLIAGTYFRNNGEFNTTGGNGITFTTPDGTAIERVYCLDTDPSNDCSDGGLRSGTDTELVEVEPRLNDVPAMPAMTGSHSPTSCENSTSDTCDIVIDDDITLSTADFANWGANSTLTVCTLTAGCTQTVVTPVTAVTTGTTTTLVADVRKCTGNKSPVSSCQNKNDSYTTTPSLTQTLTTTATVTVGTLTGVTTTGFSTTVVAANPELAQLKSHCFQGIDSGTTVTYCNLDTLKLNPSKTLNIDTSGGPIRFYFPNPSTSGSPSIDLGNGNSAIYQSNSSGITKYTDLVFYGIPRTELNSKCPTGDACQQVEFGGGTPDTSAFFAYFPGGEATLIGSATIEGVLWSNVINATGSPNFVTSSAGVGDVLSLIGMDDQTPDGGGSGNVSLLEEYVTRVTRRFSFFGG